MSDLYDKIKEDVELRREWAETAGFGIQPSGVTSKPAIRGQFKTGQRDWPKT